MQIFLGKRIHFIGIGGVGVNALAQYVLDSGGKVSGSDAKFSELCSKIAQAGADVYEGVNPSAVVGADAVVYTSAVKPDHPELVCARNMDIPIYERQEFLREIACVYKNVVGIAGTHGKTTTTAMLAHILAASDKSFVGMIGGNSVDYGNYVNNSRGLNEMFIVEACEYKRNFLTLDPTVAVVTNVECDHPDCYSDFKSVKQAFDQYLEKASCKIFLKSDCGSEWELVKSDVSGKEVYRGRIENGSCKLYRENEALCEIILSGGGDYNFKNATFAIVTSTTLGVDICAAAAALKTFGGVCRRFEYAGKIDGVPIYFDFAHHPTEISCVLKRASEYGKILAIFQPHTYSRTKAYFENFVDVFGANEDIGSLIFMPTYAAREKFDKAYEVDNIAAAIFDKFGKFAHVADNGAFVCKYVTEFAKSFNIVLFIGAGDIYDLKAMLKYDSK